MLHTEKYIRMTEAELQRHIAYLVCIIRASEDYSAMITDQVHRQDKQMLTRYKQSANKFVKHFMGVALSEDEIDDALEDSSEYFIEMFTLLVQANESGKSIEVTDAVKRVLEQP